MSAELAKTYNPNEIEEHIYQWWEEQRYFQPEKQSELGLVSSDSPSWCITLPPPNVTGALHLGHAIVASLEDLMARYHRMRGYLTLFLPGCDHAGIATQNVVERELSKVDISRYELGREKFIERVWEWKEVYHARILQQSKRLGMSCDWSRERFTLDSFFSHAVRTAFVHLYKKGLILKGTYLVNWCPRCTSAISDLEVELEEQASHLWYIRYPIINDDWDGPKSSWGSGRWAEGATTFIEMATTRPETILGDSAVAINPDDERWNHLIGKIAVLPVLGRHINVVGDEAVDPDFGTGAVKVTPAHDPTDREIGERHNLDVFDIMTDTAKMNENAGPYKSLDRFECRKQIVEDFKKEGLLLKVVPHRHVVGTCQRCHTTVEPRLSTQWFVNVKSLANAAMAVVQDGTTKIIPEREEQRFYYWMENIRPWCISRQLWWGHRIPVWYCDECGEQTCETDDPTECAHCGSTHITQDEDVLDTWFSSGLWPFATLGWPKTDASDYRRFYPTNIRETGYDILFFWVAREMMLGIEMTGQTPYPTVYLHGMVRDKEGKKISKSMENVEDFDPLNVIAKYGCDALRYTLLTSSTPGLDTNLDLRRLEGAHNFANKIWQATRFVLANTEDNLVNFTLSPEGDLELVDRWILSRLNRLIKQVTALFENHQYGEAGRQINDFLWSEFCDWYIEASKIRLYDDTIREKNVPRFILLHTLEKALRLLHPFMPFVTERLWQALPETIREGPALILARWPEAELTWLDEKSEADMGLMINLIRSIRNIRTEYNVAPSKRVSALISTGEEARFLESQRAILCTLAKLHPDYLIIEPSLQSPGQAATVIEEGVVCYLPLVGLIDLETERERLSQEMEEIKARIARSEEMLAGDFALKAPVHIVQRERDNLDNWQATLEKFRERLASLGNL